MFHLFLDFLKKIVKKERMLFFKKRRESQGRGDGLKREGLKLVTNYGGQFYANHFRVNIAAGLRPATLLKRDSGTVVFL